MGNWKREKVPDHKFDFVNVHDFVKKDFASRVKYLVIFFMVLKAVLVYLGDLYSAGRLILADDGGLKTKTKLIPSAASKWIFVGSVALSFVLLFIEVRKAKRLIASGDISFAFTNVIAKRYFSLTSYAHWCFFEEITDQLSTLDNLAFFVFFAFKGWKRLLICDGPRQIVNALILFSVTKEKGFSLNPNKYGLFTSASLGVMAFTVAVFTISACLLAVAFLIYLPLLCKIRGNLKEYCCHLIDKRIEKLLKRQRNMRVEKAKKKGSVNYNGQKPTLPVLDYDDDNQPKPPPMMYNNNNYGMPPQNDPYSMGRSNIPRSQTPKSPGMYQKNMEGGYNVDSSQGIVPVSPSYLKKTEAVNYPSRPDSNNSNSAYSDTSTKYSGQGRNPPYQYQPHQYHYQQMPQGGYKDSVEDYNNYAYVDEYVQDSNSNSYNYQNQNDPYSNSNQYYEAYYENNDHNNYYPPSPTRDAQFPINSGHPPQNNMYQQNRHGRY